MKKTTIVIAILLVAVIGMGCAGLAPKKPLQDTGIGDEETTQRSSEKAMELFLEGRVAEAQEDYDEAAVWYMEALQHDPESDEIALALATAFVGSGKELSARKYARRAVELNEKNAKAWQLVQWLEEHAGNYGKAAEALEMYIEHAEGTSVNEQIRLGQLYFLAEQDEKAMETLVPLIDPEKMPAGDMSSIAELLITHGHTEEALDIYRSIIERDPADEDAWIALGYVYVSQNEISKAKEVFREGLDKNPDSVKLLVVLGNICLDENDWDCAIRYFEAADAAGANLTKIHQTLCALYFYAGQDEKALSKLESLQQSGNDTPQLYFSLGKAMNHLERYEDAEDYYSRGFAKLDASAVGENENKMPEMEVLEAFQRMAIALVHQGKDDKAVELIHDVAPNYVDDTISLKLLESSLYSELERYEDAIAILEWLSSSDPEDVSFLIRLSVLYDMTDNFEKSEKVLNKVIELDPDNALALNNLAYMYTEHNMKLDRAIELVRRALEIDPDNGAYHDTLGWAYFQKGDYGEAQEHIERALEYADDIDKGVIYDHYGDVLVKLDKPGQAQDAYRKAIEFGEDETIITRKMQLIAQ